jgi:hypothetical protein
MLGAFIDLVLGLKHPLSCERTAKAGLQVNRKKTGVQVCLKKLKQLQEISAFDDR